ncbi:hypothetical protein SVIOM342S_06461 [Streptomyces violaceorubidus]
MTPSVAPAQSASDSAAPTSASASPATSPSGRCGSRCASRAAAAISCVTNATISSRIAATSAANRSPCVRACRCSTRQASGCRAVWVKNARSPDQSCPSADSPGRTPARTASVRARASRPMQALKRSSFEFRYRYTSGLDTPASSAISSIDAAMYPRLPKTLTAASSICCSRTARGIRLVFPAPMRISVRSVRR